MLDIDPRHGGLASLEALKKRRPLPRGPQVLTGGGGQHLYFAHPGGSVANSSGRLGDGLDVRGDGGYVVAPPSLHMTGNSYKWLRPLNGALPNAGDLFTAEGPSGSSAVVDDVIPQGTRRTSMLRVAGALKRRGLSGDEILPTLAQLNRRCRPPLDEAELRTIAYPSTIAADPASSTPFVPGRLAATPITEIQMRSIEWLERPLWQRSAFQLLAGAKGAGKGTYLAGFAARISRDANVLFVSSEDSTEIDLKPRLVAAGADIGRCFVIQQHVQLPEDVTDLRLLAESLGGVGLLVIDPVANHIGDSNSNSEAEVRHAIAPLNPLANDLDSLVIGVRHPGKDNTRGALASILGSTAWTATPRSAVMIVPDDEDPQLRHIQVVAGNRSLNGSRAAVPHRGRRRSRTHRADHARRRPRCLHEERRRPPRRHDEQPLEDAERHRVDPRHPRGRRFAGVRHPRREGRTRDGHQREDRQEHTLEAERQGTDQEPARQGRHRRHRPLGRPPNTGAQIMRDLAGTPHPYTLCNGIWTIQAVPSRDLDSPHPDVRSTGSGSGCGCSHGSLGRDGDGPTASSLLACPTTTRRR